MWMLWPRIRAVFRALSEEEGAKRKEGSAGMAFWFAFFRSLMG